MIFIIIYLLTGFIIWFVLKNLLLNKINLMAESESQAKLAAILSGVMYIFFWPLIIILIILSI